MAHEIKHWQNRLLALKTDLLRLEEESKESRDAVELDQTRVGRLSRIDALQAQAMNNAIASRRQQTLARIEASFERLAEDEFGYCLKCGDEIADKRLEFDPTILYCADCSQ